MSSAELSIVIPLLNESDALKGLFATLAAQEGVAFEVVLSDGGSRDGTVELAERLAREASFAVRVIHGKRGRGRQLNAGAAVARGTLFLFLHADSTFDDARALSHGVSALEEKIVARGDERVAGHFALRFDRQSDEPSLGYAYYETKAQLDRRGCTHGDQGFLLRRSFFEALGPFDESLPVLEDTLFAERVREQGEWVLLPAQVRTSARRFETEGLKERQTLNALIMNFAAIGWSDFFRVAPEIYRQQDRTGRLQLLPFLKAIRDLLRPLPMRERFRLWTATGRYVRSNAWQLALARQTRCAFLAGDLRPAADTGRLERFDRIFDGLTDHVGGYLATTILVWFWFRATLFFLDVRQRGRKEAVHG